MDEIIEKLRDKTPEASAKLTAEPVTARVSRERDVAKRLVTPPELFYRSPHVTNRFYSQAPAFVYPAHVCAASMEADAFGLLASRSRTKLTDYQELLVQSDLLELRNVSEYAKGIETDFRSAKLRENEQHINEKSAMNEGSWVRHSGNQGNAYEGFSNYRS